ncbi:efflux RND transporter periplasmic adaptor subunit [Romeria aff. gracilis LEGE 07310]|uniref:Efflux RND transporter periplasmic adaptor subunit n=1 Tax=Vasconcelosia minhoensis LEGE 07310 TaxID=915328 RepID=A0A8J7A5Y3_9CYAN|nr:efflux RND transporter periplasmic adaptor subunit [Romeria gracilis]MBE9076510.1 efflux RND transporter periplasmic adaptor subunit [Romeria aff. gracilis LEGE 07310]
MHLPLIGKLKRPRPWLIGLIVVGLLGAGAIAFFILRRPAPYDVAELTVPVAAEGITVRITASGDVEPIRTVNLSPKAAGIVEELYVEQGDRVQAGQIVARMRSDELEAQIVQNRGSLAEAEAALRDVQQGSTPTDVAQAEANLAAVEAQVRDARARLDLANEDLNRNQQLADQGAIAQNELDRAVSEVRSARANLEQTQSRVAEAEQRLADLRNDPDPEDLDQAQARVRQAQGRLQAIQTQVEDTIIRAPFGGIVTQKFATEGAFVTPTTSASEASSATSTAIIAIADGLEVVAEVPEADISRIQIGQAVEIQADAFPEQLFEGAVRLIAPEAIERQNVTVFQVRIRLITGEDRLRSNMNVTVAFLGDQLDDALVVPAVSIITQSGETGVLVPGEDNRVEFVPVTLGPQVGDQIQVLDGLEAGDRVFIDLPPGQRLENLTFGRERS